MINYLQIATLTTVYAAPTVYGIQPAGPEMLFNWLMFIFSICVTSVSIAIQRSLSLINLHINNTKNRNIFFRKILILLSFRLI